MPNTRDLYWARKQQGVCVRCRKVDERTKNGKPYCEACKEKISRRVREHVQRDRANGICPVCGRSYDGSTYYCDYCKNYYNKKYKNKKKPKTDE